MATILSSADRQKGNGKQEATAIRSSYNADFSGLAKAAFVTSSGTVSYRSGWVIAYPEVVAWARLQALYYRGHGIAAGPDFPYALDCTETYAAIKHQNSVQTLLACLLMCSPQDLTSFAASLFDFLEQRTSLAGMESIFLSTLNAVGPSGNALFDQGVQIWQRLRSTCGSDSLLLVEKNLSCAVTVNGKGLATLDLSAASPGRVVQGMLGNLKASMPVLVGRSQPNPLDAALASGAITESGCVGLFAAAGAIGGTLGGGWPAGTSAGAGVGTIAGAILCGVEYDKTPTSSQTGPMQTGPEIDTTPTDPNDPTPTDPNDPTPTDPTPTDPTPTDPTSTDPTQQSTPSGNDQDNNNGGTCDPHDPPNNNGGMPDPEGDTSPGGPRSLGMTLSPTATIAIGNGLSGLVSYGPSSVAIIHDMPVIEFSSGVLIKAGFAATASNAVGGENGIKGAGAWQMYPADWVTITNALGARPAFTSPAKEAIVHQ